MAFSVSTLITYAKKNVSKHIIKILLKVALNSIFIILFYNCFDRMICFVFYFNIRDNKVDHVIATLTIW